MMEQPFSKRDIETILIAAESRAKGSYDTHLYKEVSELNDRELGVYNWMRDCDLYWENLSMPLIKIGPYVVMPSSYRNSLLFRKAGQGFSSSSDEERSIRLKD